MELVNTLQPKNNKLTLKNK